MATAWLRALHLVADDAPPVFADHEAAAFLSPQQQRFLRRLAALPRPWLRAFRQRRDALTSMRSQIVVRARYAEDALAAARERGCARYLVLAAGLDTFALRQASAGEPSVPVVEIDHPATQAWKVRWLSEHGHTSVPGLRFAAVDFERDRLADQLPAAEGPQFISWLGTTYYLSAKAISATLRTLAETSPAGSSLVLDYWRQPSAFDPGSALLWGTRMATALQQEPMRAFFDPGAMERLAVEAGWRVRENCAPLIQDQRYLAGRKDDLAVPTFAFLLHLER
jgi:methyltransferase (TIGR00027 family)